jgi:hypothetical protein
VRSSGKQKPAKPKTRTRTQPLLLSSETIRSVSEELSRKKSPVEKQLLQQLLSTWEQVSALGADHRIVVHAAPRQRLLLRRQRALRRRFQMCFNAPPMTARTALIAVALITLAGCRGPKGSPEGSVKSFFSAAVAQDFEAMSETLAVESRQKLGSNAAGRLAQMFGGWDSADVTIDDYNEDANGQSATVRFTCVATEIVNYKAKEFDCSDTVALVKEEDGKWHIILAMGKTLKPM